jgi:hypothetical protein
MAAKFVPGLNAIAAPLAGIAGMRMGQFLFFDICGVLLWAMSYIGLGYIFTDQLEDVADYALRLGQFLILLLAGLIVAYVGHKYAQRRRFLHDLRILRITAIELKQRIDSGELVQIMDLRHSLDFAADPSMLPGAIHAEPEDIDHLLPQIAVDRDVILYCS